MVSNGFVLDAIPMLYTANHCPSCGFASFEVHFCDIGVERAFQLSMDHKSNSSIRPSLSLSLLFPWFGNVYKRHTSMYTKKIYVYHMYI